MTVDVIDYIGKFNEAIIVLISLGHEFDYYEGTFYYEKDSLVLTVEERLEEKLGCFIEEWSDYEPLIDEIFKKVIPYDEMIGRVDEFNPGDYGLYLDAGTQSTLEQNNTQQ
jgi:hypothetical protein